MSEADKMFDEIGYEKIGEEFLLKGSDFKISFSKLFRSVLIEGGDDAVLGMKELKAINQKCKELGWLDE